MNLTKTKMEIIPATEFINTPAMDSLRTVARRNNSTFTFDSFYEIIVALQVSEDSMIVVEKVNGIGAVSYIISTFTVTVRKPTFFLKIPRQPIVTELLHDVCFSKREVFVEVNKMLQTYGNFILQA